MQSWLSHEAKNIQLYDGVGQCSASVTSIIQGCVAFRSGNMWHDVGHSDGFITPVRCTHWYFWFIPIRIPLHYLPWEPYLMLFLLFVALDFVLNKHLASTISRSVDTRSFKSILDNREQVHAKIRPPALTIWNWFLLDEKN